jgi:hypothetical protein
MIRKPNKNQVAITFIAAAAIICVLLLKFSLEGESIKSPQASKAAELPKNSSSKGSESTISAGLTKIFQAGKGTTNGTMESVGTTDKTNKHYLPLAKRGGIIMEPVGSTDSNGTEGSGSDVGYSSTDSQPPPTDQDTPSSGGGVIGGGGGVTGGGGGVTGGGGGVTGGGGGVTGGGGGVIGGGGFGTTDPTNLSQLPPLPKIHYSWGLRPKFLNDRESNDLYELARLTHSLCVAGEWVASSQIDNCVYTCDRVNKTNPEIPCSIGINYSPWHYKFMPELGLSKPIPGNYDFTIFKNPTYDAEIKQFVLQMTSIKQLISRSNQKYDTDVKISAILLDCERFSRRENDTQWNEGMREALDAIHREAAKLFPDARIEWYDRGMTSTDGIIFRQSGYCTNKEIMSSRSCSLYIVPEMEVMRGIFRKTCELADSLKVQEVTPYVALASGYKRDSLQKPWVWKDWDYDVTYSYQTGRELNGTDAPYNRAAVIVFYPDPFNPSYPAWGKHFVEYCKGAAQANSPSK